MAKYRFPTTARKERYRPTKIRVTKVPEPTQFIVQGKLTDSKEEYWFAKALDQLKLDYLYQVPLGGGRTISGGIVLDFYVYTVPKPTPVLIQGTRWHTNSFGRQDYFKIRQINKWLPFANKPVEVWDTQLLDESMAMRKVYELFR